MPTVLVGDGDRITHNFFKCNKKILYLFEVFLRPYLNPWQLILRFPDAHL